MAVVLAGGLGMRLRPYTMNIPKPLLPLGDQATMEIVLQQLAGQGFDRVVITLGYMSQLVESLLGDGKRFGMRIEYIVEGEPLGTAGSLNLVKDLDETFLVMNGDLLTTIDYSAVVASHRAEEHSATVVLARRDVPIDYGLVYVDEQGCLERYEEKPTLHHFVSTGIYALNRSAAARVPPGRFDMPDLITDLVTAGEQVRCHITDEYWQDIGRFEDYQQASADFVKDPERFLPSVSANLSS